MFKWLLKSAFFFSVFTSFDTHLLASPTIYFHYFFIAGLLPVLIHRHRTIPVYLLILNAVFFLVGVYHILLGNHTLPLFLKVFSSVSLFILFAYFYLKHEEYNVKGIFKLYLQCAIIICCVFFAQWFFYIVGFPPGYDFSYLGMIVFQDPDIGYVPTVFFGEPAHLAITLAPAMFIAVQNLITRKKYFINYFYSVLIIATVIFTYSSTGYLALIICLVVIGLNYRTNLVLIASIAVGISGFFLLYAFNPKFQMRFDDSAGVFLEGRLSDEKQLKNGSTMILYNNLEIAKENFKNHPFAGTGLGSHPVAFGRYSLFTQEDIWWADMNKEDACSLFIRMMSETGILGLGLLFFYLCKFRVKRRESTSDENWLISSGIIVFIIIELIRSGSYMLSGFPFFILLYYYLYKADLEARRLPTSALV